LSQAKQETKEKILDAVLDLIRNEGFQHVTVRKIAERAGVNVASVNYHFGSKDLAVNAALSRMTGDFRAAFEALEEEGYDPRRRLENFLFSYADAVSKYPDVIKNFIVQSIQENAAQNEFIAFFRQEGLAALQKTLLEITREEQPEKLVRAKMLQLIAASVFPALLGPAFKKITGSDYADSRYRREYIALLLRDL